MFNSEVSCEQMESLFKHSKDLVFFMKREQDDFRYLYVNPSAYRIVPNIEIGKRLTEVTDANLTKGILNNYFRALQEQQQVAFQDYTYHTNEVRKYETSVLPIIDGNEQYIFATTKEIAFDRDLQDKYLFMRSVFFKTFLSTVLISNNGELVEANPCFIKDFDLNMEETRGKEFTELPFIDPTTVKDIKRYLQESQQGENFSSQLLTFIDVEGKPRHFTGAFSPLMRDDEVAAVFIVLQDITAYVHQSQMLREASHNLQAMHRAISASANITFTDTNGRITDANDRFLETTGYTREELLGQTHQILNSDYHGHAFFHTLWETVNAGKVWRGEIRNRRKNGELYWIDSTIIPLTNEHGVVKQYFTVNFDVTSKMKALDELRNNERIFNLITDRTNDFIVTMNRQGDILYISPSYSRKLGYPIERLLQMNYTQLLSEDSKLTWTEHFASTRSRLQDVRLELELVTSDGNHLWTEANYTIAEENLVGRDELVMISREINARKEKESQLTYLAYHDSLTQLPNRRYLQEEFPNVLQQAKRFGHTFAMFYIDGDNFKSVNDCYGHDVGDLFLQHFGQTLMKSVQSCDRVIRIGGDEFIVIARELASDRATRLAQVDHRVKKIQEALKAGWTINGQFFSPTTSIGIAFYPEHGETLKQLVDTADGALYEAKKMKNHYYIAQMMMKEPKC